MSTATLEILVVLTPLIVAVLGVFNVWQSNRLFKNLNKLEHSVNGHMTLLMKAIAREAKEEGRSEEAKRHPDT